MSFEYRVVEPYPLPASVLLKNGNSIAVDVIKIENRGCIVETKTPFLKNGDVLTLDMKIPDQERTPISEKAMVVKIYIHFHKGKPHYCAEILFKNIIAKNGAKIDFWNQQMEMQKTKAEAGLSASKKHS